MSPMAPAARPRSMAFLAQKFLLAMVPTVVADEAYIRESICNPMRKL